MLSYEDTAAMADWLVRAFGFVEAVRLYDASGTVTHVELRHDSGAIMLSTPSPDYRSPSSHRRECAFADAWLATTNVVDGVLVRVTDVDDHYHRASKAGATILTVPMDAGPGRLYRAGDPEGHRWMFIQQSDPERPSPQEVVSGRLDLIR